MKSYLPIFVLLAGLLGIVLAGFIFFNVKSKKDVGREEPTEVAQRELPVDQRPYLTLTPNSQGNELTFAIARIAAAVSTLEYELTYTARAQPPNTGDVLQGVPGSVDVVGKTSLERKLTLGTCSSGVCRYDRDVRDINLLLKLRDKDGKLISKFESGVTLVTKVKELKSADGKLKFTPDKAPVGYWIVINTIGLPSNLPPGDKIVGPYGIFGSSSEKMTGTVNISGAVVQVWDGSKWVGSADGKAKIPGIFVGISP